MGYFDVEYTVTIILITIAFILVCCAFSSLMYEFYIRSDFSKYPGQKRKTVSKYFQITSILSLVFALVCIIADWIHVFDGWVNRIGLRADYFKPLRTVANVHMFQSLIATDLVILGRLYFSFQGSVYEISRYTLSFIMVVLVIIIFCDVMYLVLLLTEWNFLYEIKEDTLLILAVMELLVSFFMSVMFSKKLHQLLSSDNQAIHKTISVRSKTQSMQQPQEAHAPAPEKEQEQEPAPEPPQSSLQLQPGPNSSTAAGIDSAGERRSSGRHINSSSRHGRHRQSYSSSVTFSAVHLQQIFGEDIQLNDRQKKLLNLSAKNTIITGIAALYFLIRFGYRQFAVRYDTEETIEPIWMISYVSRTFIFVSNAIAVYFGFAFVFNQNLYQAIFGKCHSCVGRICIRMAKMEVAVRVDAIIRESEREDHSKQSNHEQEKDDVHQNNEVQLIVAAH